MNYSEAAPRKLPLILILIGTTILAVPAAFGTIALFDTSSSPNIAVNSWLGRFLFCISSCGFGLYAGYILTAIFRRHSSVFWLCSMLYNFGLSGFYFYSFIKELPSLIVDVPEILLNPLILILPWTIFVTIASGYYFKFALRARTLDLS